MKLVLRPKYDINKQDESWTENLLEKFLNPHFTAPPHPVHVLCDFMPINLSTEKKERYGHYQAFTKTTLLDIRLPYQTEQIVGSIENFCAAKMHQ